MTFLEKILSFKVENTNKVVTIFGFKMYFKSKFLTLREEVNNIKKEMKKLKSANKTMGGGQYK